MNPEIRFSAPVSIRSKTSSSHQTGRLEQFCTILLYGGASKGSIGVADGDLPEV
jgi:hypothetical protein